MSDGATDLSWSGAGKDSEESGGGKGSEEPADTSFEGVWELSSNTNRSTPVDRSSVGTSFEGLEASDPPFFLKAMGGLNPPSASDESPVILHCSSSAVSQYMRSWCLDTITTSNKKKSLKDTGRSVQRTTGVTQVNGLSPNKDKEKNPSEWEKS